MVIVTVEDGSDAVDGGGNRHIASGHAGEGLGDEEGLRQEVAQPTARPTSALSSADSSSMPSMEIKSFNSS